MIRLQRGFSLPPYTLDDPLSSGSTVGNLREIKRAMEEEEARAAVPWWMGLSTIERALAMKAEIEGQVASFAEAHKEFEEAFARLGFAGHAPAHERKPRTPRSS
jgi:hypothetical protein